MKKVILALFLATTFLGCATIMKGSKQVLTINCNVDGASIFLDGKKIGVTPFRGKVKKNKNSLEIRAEGYKTYYIALSTKIEPMFLGNIIFGGVFGSTTDFASGAAYQYAPASYQVDLRADGMSSNKFNQRANLKKFAMINISNIAKNIAQNEGPYLSTLLTLAQLEENDFNKNLIRQNFDKSQGDQVLFGKLMVAHIAQN